MARSQLLYMRSRNTTLQHDYFVAFRSIIFFILAGLSATGQIILYGTMLAGAYWFDRLLLGWIVSLDLQIDRCINGVHWIRSRPREIKRWMFPRQGPIAPPEIIFDLICAQFIWTQFDESDEFNTERKCYEERQRALMDLQPISRDFFSWSRRHTFEHFYIEGASRLEAFVDYLEKKRYRTGHQLAGTAPHLLMRTLIVSGCPNREVGGKGTRSGCNYEVGSILSKCEFLETLAIREMEHFNFRLLAHARHRSLTSLCLDAVSRSMLEWNSTTAEGVAHFVLPSLRRLELRRFGDRDDSDGPVPGGHLQSLRTFLHPNVLPQLVSLSIVDSPRVQAHHFTSIASQIRLLNVQTLDRHYHIFNNLWLLNITSTAERPWDIVPRILDFHHENESVVLPSFKILRIDAMFDTPHTRQFWDDFYDVLEMDLLPKAMEKLILHTHWFKNHEKYRYNNNRQTRVYQSLTEGKGSHLCIELERDDKRSSVETFVFKSRVFETRFDKIIWQDWLAYERKQRRRLGIAVLPNIN